MKSSPLSWPNMAKWVKTSENQSKQVVWVFDGFSDV